MPFSKLKIKFNFHFIFQAKNLKFLGITSLQFKRCYT